MVGSRVLAFGATRPAGICLLRDCLYRNHETVAFARNPSKIPADFASNPLLRDEGRTNRHRSPLPGRTQARVVVSLLGPNQIRGIQPEMYSDFYKALFSQMRAHGVRRIFAMATLSFEVPEDRFSLQRLLVVGLVRAVVPGGYQTVHRICAAFFQEEEEGIDWALFRIAGIPEGLDEKSRREDR
ncbi:hypothetical protein N657DRAFT_714363 [Parathielavia appendiculata]|uniref:NAD(P)-binding domain-containing protein n=1 Tax=Parathielavia appendiculata TaxID=2587402 RepID=A0AAN6Z434_9PEZI|nr:hypothetical protein N657DRAFT_714363 [Parathielavia appendiculata]